jgi:NitT/TauT family transport system substrate-binding protein
MPAQSGGYAPPAGPPSVGLSPAVPRAKHGPTINNPPEDTMTVSRRSALQFAAGLIAATAIASPVSAQEPLKIRIGWSTMPGHMIPVLYSKPEILKHYGKSYTVEPILFRGSTPQITAMAAGEIDMAAFAPLAMGLGILNARLDVKAVADIIQDGVEGYHSDSFLVHKDSGIKTIADLKGKRVGMNAIGSAADTTMKAMFKKNGPLGQRDYTLMEASFPNIPIMLEEGKIDMGIVIQPYKQQMLATGKYDVLFTARDALGPVQFVFLAARTDFLEKNRQKLYDFFEDHVRAMRWFNDPKNHAEAVQIIATFVKQKPETLQYLFTKDDYFRDPFLFPNVKGIQSMADTSHEVGLLPQKVELAPKYIDTSFVAEAKKRIEADAKK